MSGTQGTLAAFNFGAGYGLPYTVFAPVYWAPLNTSGVGSPSPSDLFSSALSQGTGITPQLLAASQANLANIAFGGLQTISFSGSNNASMVGNFLQQWSDTLSQIGHQNANTFAEAVSKSAKACSGFFSCLFG